MTEPLQLPDQYSATLWEDPEIRAIWRAILSAHRNPLLPLLQRAVEHIDLLQTKVIDCGGACNCACDFDNPGDKCLVHFPRTLGGQ